MNMRSLALASLLFASVFAVEWTRLSPNGFREGLSVRQIGLSQAFAPLLEEATRAANCTAAFDASYIACGSQSCFSQGLKEMSVLEVLSVRRQTPAALNLITSLQGNDPKSCTQPIQLVSGIIPTWIPTFTKPGNHTASNYSATATQGTKTSTSTHLSTSTSTALVTVTGSEKPHPTGNGVAKLGVTADVISVVSLLALLTNML
ncbi:hypothetical protein AJ80_04345 [Polytolypa hystricis UAMH7299]|uniref:Secreted protein n=1 Tax=Polytolypa hystricis (strain UAMH7299) TaxID=1447883 RepID=A0A2B7YCU9_POLH7|nr:hypothetical protein AJ80_04345 [Polytolypa hystricis UAMH7299]